MSGSGNKRVGRIKVDSEITPSIIADRGRRNYERMVDSSFGRKGLLSFATLYTFFFVGAIFGWGPMQRMLEASGAFSGKCEPGEELPCPAQSNAILNVNFLAIASNCFTPLMGMGIDSYGAPNVSAWFMAPSAILGSAIVAIAAYSHADATDNLDWLYFVGFIFLGLATFAGSVTNIQVGLMFSGPTSVTIIMFLCALFDAGSVTYLFLWMMIKGIDGVDFPFAMLIYFGLAVVSYGGAAYFWKTAVSANDEISLLVDGGDEDETEDLIHKEEMEVAESMREYQAGMTRSATKMKAQLNSYRQSLRESARPKDGGYGSTANGGSSKPTASDDGYILIADRSFKEQMLSTPFLMLSFFFAINMLSCNWALTTAADFMAQYGDTGKYLSIFTIMQPCSILAMPVTDYTVAKFGFGASFQTTNLLTFGFCLIKVLSTNLNVIIIHGVLVAAMRCYLYATTFAYVPQLLNEKYVGKGTGLLYLVGGLLSFLNIPLNNMVLTVGFGPINWFYLIMTIPTTYMAYVVQATIGKEAKAKAAKAGIAE